MLQRTYDKVNALFEEGNGYLPTRTLLNNKIISSYLPALFSYTCAKL